MQIITPSVEFITDLSTLDPKVIVDAGRTCYKANKPDYTPEEVDKFIRKLIKAGHESPLEHLSFTVKFITDRGLSHELVRHRLATFTQESTRYVNYSKDKFGNEITCIMPDYGCYKWTDETDQIFRKAYQQCEENYMALINAGMSPQYARAVLPTGLKTELVMTANIREWRHILKLRLNPAAHPDIRFLCYQIYDKLNEYHPYFLCDMRNDGTPKEE